MTRRVCRSAIFCLAVSFVIALATSPAARQEAPPPAQAPAQAQPPPPDPAVERGRKQFQESCGFCHGNDATGARGPDLVRSPVVAHDVKGDQLGQVIRQGRPDKGMPPMQLSDQQVSDIAAFLHARALESLNSAEVPKVYPVEKLLSGNAAAGKAYFEGAGGCTKCHSVTGDLAGVAKKLSPMDLEARMLYPEKQHHVTATVTLPSGEQIKGPLVHADDFVVSLKDANGWYRSFSRDRVKIELQDQLAAHRELLDKLTQKDFHDLFAYLETLK